MSFNSFFVDGNPEDKVSCDQSFVFKNNPFVLKYNKKDSLKMKIQALSLLTLSIFTISIMSIKIKEKRKITLLE